MYHGTERYEQKLDTTACRKREAAAKPARKFEMNRYSESTSFTLWGSSGQKQRGRTNLVDTNRVLQATPK